MRRAISYLDVNFIPDGVTLVAGESGDLGAALERIAAGEADTLIVTALRSVAGTLSELLSLIGWLDETHASLIAVDVRLDTTTQQGRRMVALLREVESWQRDPDRPRGRPGLARTAPHVAERIATLRARGLGLKAIADALNAEGIPTPRGGAEWRASSVQSALGYRRPKPPPPGAPKPPSHGTPKPPSHGTPKPPRDGTPKPPRDGTPKPPRHGPPKQKPPRGPRHRPSPQP